MQTNKKPNTEITVGDDTYKVSHLLVGPDPIFTDETLYRLLTDNVAETLVRKIMDVTQIDDPLKAFEQANVVLVHILYGALFVGPLLARAIETAIERIHGNLLDSVEKVRLHSNLITAFVRVSSYQGTEQVSEPKIKFAEKLEYLQQSSKPSVAIVLDDIYDTGKTLRVVNQLLKEQFKPQEIVNVVAFIRDTGIAEYREGFDNALYAQSLPEDVFIFGLGLDINDRLRYLRELWYVHSD